MATLKKSKLDAVIDHIKGGGDESLEVIADIVGIDINEDEFTVEAYVRKAKKDIAATAKPEPARQPSVEPPVTYQLKDSFGVLRDLEVLRQKGNRIILAEPVVRDIVTVLIKGVEEIVDLEELRKLGPDELRFGIKVSSLIAAAELAKG